MKIWKGTLITFLLILLAGTCTGGAVQAKTWTKKSVNAELKKTKTKISTTKKKLKVQQAKYKAELKKWNSQAKGTVALWAAEVISTDPLVVYEKTGHSYYWIEGGKKNIAVLFGAAIGRIRTTGKYRQYNLLTCAVANGVNVAAKPSKYLEQVEKLESKLDDLQEKSSRLRGALKYGPSFDTKYMKKKLKSVVSVSDNTVTLEMPSEVVRMGKYVDLPYYSSLVGWKSSNESVATVSSKGVVTIKKAGTFTLTVKTSVSGKKASQKFKVIEKKKDSDDPKESQNQGDDQSQDNDSSAGNNEQERNDDDEEENDDSEKDEAENENDNDYADDDYADDDYGDDDYDDWD